MCTLIPRYLLKAWPSLEFYQVHIPATDVPRKKRMPIAPPKGPPRFRDTSAYGPPAGTLPFVTIADMERVVRKVVVTQMRMTPHVIKIPACAAIHGRRRNRITPTHGEGWQARETNTHTYINNHRAVRNSMIVPKLCQRTKRPVQHLHREEHSVAG